MPGSKPVCSFSPLWPECITHVRQHKLKLFVPQTSLVFTNLEFGLDFSLSADIYTEKKKKSDNITSRQFLTTDCVTGIGPHFTRIMSCRAHHKTLYVSVTVFFRQEKCGSELCFV